MTPEGFSPVDDVLADLRAGRPIVLTDDESRENEGDLVMAAEFVTPESVMFLVSVARGYLCLSLTEADCDRLELAPQAAVNTTSRGTAFTVSIDGHPRHGFTTGVSAAERARTIRMAIDPAFGPGDFVRPGHINPLRSRDGGVLVRTGQTEGSLDLCRLAGLYPAAAIIEILRDDGEMARVPDLVPLCRRHGLKLCSIKQIIEHRLSRESLVRRMDPAEGTPLATTAGEFRLFAYEARVDSLPHVALTVGGLGRPGAEPVTAPVLVRMHRRNLLGDLFEDLASAPGEPTGRTLRGSMARIRREGVGAIVYLRTEGVGDHIGQRLMRFRRGDYDRGGDETDLTHPSGPAAALGAEQRDFGIGCQILRDLGVRRLRLLTNNPRALPGLDGFGLEVVEHVPVT